MSRFLVTGGAGFIGSHLTDRLLEGGYQVRVLDDLSTGRSENLHPDAELIVGSVTDRNVVQKAFEGCEGCFHLAAIASVAKCNTDWAASHTVNVTGAITVFEAALAHGHHPVVYASSAAVYGNIADLPLGEQTPAAPLSAYGADKYGCELHARAAYTVHGLPTTGLRMFNIYGSRQNPLSPYSGVISIFADRLKRGKAITIHGDGLQTRDFVNVADAVEALMHSMFKRQDAARVFNVCTGRSNSLLDLVNTLAEILDVTPQTTFAPARAGDIRDSLGSPALLERELGFLPQISLHSGLINTLG